MLRCAPFGISVAAVVLCLGCSGSVDPFVAIDSGDQVFASSVGSIKDLEARGEGGMTPLLFAAQRGRTLSLELLLDRGAKIDARDAAGFTALHLAAQRGHAGCAKALLDRGAGPELEAGPRKVRPLHLAVQRGDRDTVALLLSRGADVNAKTSWGETSLMMLARGGPESLFEALVRPNLDWNAVDLRSYTALHIAADADNDAFIRRWSAEGHSLDPVTLTGATPLDIALQNRRDRAAQFLFDRGAGVVLAEDVPPPLVVAARDDDVGSLLWLLASGADVTKTFDDETALAVATRCGSLGAMKILGR
jgi:ankyrin